MHSCVRAHARSIITGDTRVRQWASAHVRGSKGAGAPWVPSGLSAGVRGVGGPARERERVSARVRALRRSRLPWEHAAARVNHFLWKVCGRGGAGRASEAAAWSCLPLAGRARRAPGAAATPGSCLRRAGESGAGAGWGRPGRSGSVRPLLGAPRPGPPCPRDPLPAPAVGRGEGAAPESRPCAVPLPAPARSSRSRGPCPELGMGRHVR